MKAKTPYEKKGKRLGRGIGSGRGKTAGRGHKGQRSRSGAPLRPGFEGGQNPLYRRLPKRGFNAAAFRHTYAILNLKRVEELGLEEISPEVLKEKGVIKRFDRGLKILGFGDLKKAVKVKAHKFSGSAKEKIEKAGGEAVLIKN